MPRKQTQSANDRAVWLKAMDQHRAVGKILKAIRPLSQNERRRILNYFWDRYVTNPEPGDSHA